MDKLKSHSSGAEAPGIEKKPSLSPAKLFGIPLRVKALWPWINGKDTGGDDKKEDNAYVLDKRKGAGFEYVDPAKIPSSSIERQYRGKYVHLLMRDDEGKIKVPPIDYKRKPGESPEDLYDALNDNDSPKLFCSPQNSWIGPVTKAFFVVIGFMLFFLFMIWAVNIHH